ncbi:DUF547 domain-containing protein [Stieleria varia]|uniref:DUF547 domain-containing protein n=1 Tax=Stieleria varia TaxID=2528005 RepID=A0A5C6B4C7_9BACT|nr:DUF547 domain-containing protein [Stieleria varia]TWU06136.1 hypothetical protein Pla52n_18560 [Stieleria varia]
MKCMSISFCLVPLAAVCALLIPSQQAAAGTKVSVGASVAPVQQVSVDQIDHRSWDALLKRYVDQNGNVNYQAWKQSAADQQALDTYLSHLSAANPNAQASSAAKLSFWINAYNAVTIKGILREYPTSSIRNHTAKLIGYNIWDDLLLTVGGKPYSLNQMEHEVLRKMGEPRIHFAIVCASISCPRLLNEAYTADRLDEQLSTNSRNFFSNQRNFRFDAQRQQFQLSAILEWFGEDFGANQASQLQRIAPYLPQGPAQQLASQGRGSVSFLEYDWGLNDQATTRTARR